jgi:cytochrome c oxidase subunit 2
VTGSRHRRGGLRLLSIAIPIAGTALLLAGCGGSHDVLHAESHQEHRISTLFWVLAIGSFIGLGVVAFFLLLGWVRRHREGLPGGGGDKAGAGLVVVLGVAIPILVLSALFWYSDVDVIDSTSPPAAASTSMTVEVIGHQWFWEVRYPGTSAVTANEIHIPVHTRVNLVATTADVIHSFWVPELNRKIDMIPGQQNRILLDVDRVGVYRGQCSEFCGLQHAHMAMLVFADAPDVFRRWLAHMAQPAAEPRTASERRGRAVFLSQACSGCHAIRGTKAEGRVGPDLTHLQTRTTLAAVTIPNRKGDLAGWVLDPQHVKPGNKMPALPLKGPDFQDLLDYLEVLR